MNDSTGVEILKVMGKHNIIGKISTKANHNEPVRLGLHTVNSQEIAVMGVENLQFAQAQHKRAFRLKVGHGTVLITAKEAVALAYALVLGARNLGGNEESNKVGSAIDGATLGLTRTLRAYQEAHDPAVIEEMRIVEARNARRDELAKELFGASYDGLHLMTARKAVNMILDLEEKVKEAEGNK